MYSFVRSEFSVPECVIANYTKQCVLNQAERTKSGNDLHPSAYARRGRALVYEIRDEEAPLPVRDISNRTSHCVCRRPQSRAVSGSCPFGPDKRPATLSDRPAHLVGLSYGGWVAMNQALRAPARVASITLLDPAGLTKLDARFWWWLAISGLASLTPMPLRRHLARWLDSPAMLEPELMTLMWAGSRGYRMEPKFPGILTDGELRAIDVPVLLITGARSAMLTPAEARARGSLMPHAEVAIVPGSHGGFNRIDELNNRIAAFIEAHATGKQAAQPADTDN